MSLEQTHQVGEQPPEIPYGSRTQDFGAAGTFEVDVTY